VNIIPFVADLSDRIGRKPPVIVGCLLAGLLSFAYLWAISIKNVPLAILFSLLMWGVAFQGYNAVYTSFFPELFPTRIRVTAMAVAQNIGTALAALTAALFASVAPPGSSNIPLTVGAITFGISVLAALAAWTARETHRVHMNDLGKHDAVPVPKPEYDRLRAQAL
jgi:MFS family permease